MQRVTHPNLHGVKELVFFALRGSHPIAQSRGQDEMSNALHPLRRISVAQKSTRAAQRARAKSNPTVAITSVQIDTVHPTWLYTETTTLTGSRSSSTATLSETTSPATHPCSSPHNTQQAISSMAIATESLPALLGPQTLLETSVQDLPPEPPVTYSTSSNSSQSSSSISLETTSNTSSSTSSSPSTSSSSEPATITSSSQSSSTSETSSSQATSTEQIITAASLKTHSPSSLSSSPARIVSGVTASHGHAHHNVGTIVGSIIGGIAFIALVLLAFFFLFHRRRRHLQRRRQTTGEMLVRNSSSTVSTHGRHNRHSSDPTFIDRTPSHSSFRALPSPRRYSNPFEDRPSNSLAPKSNHDPSIDGNSLHEEELRGSWAPSSVSDDPFADLEFSPVSPIIELSPPSRTVSAVSRSSWQGRLQSYDPSAPSNRRSIYSPRENITTHMDQNGHNRDSLNTPSQYLDTPMTRDTRRSDPFDLEPPPNVLRKGSPIPPPNF